MTVLAVVPLRPASLPVAAATGAAAAAAAAADGQSDGFALSEILAMFDARATRTFASANVLPCSVLLACPPMSCYAAGVGTTNIILLPNTPAQTHATLRNITRTRLVLPCHPQCWF